VTHNYLNSYCVVYRGRVWCAHCKGCGGPLHPAIVDMRDPTECRFYRRFYTSYGPTT
jgi:hypothetical protein